METLIIAVMATLTLVLAGALIVALLRPGGEQGRVKDLLETLVNPRVAEIKSEMNKVSEMVRELEKDRENKFGQLTNQLKTVGENTAALATTTGQLREALANTRIRGQWGERMAEDVLRLIGFVEGINYQKQATVTGGGSRPDFTFLLPQDMKLNMDVKFPLDNYVKCVEAESVEDEVRFRQMFVRDVRDRLKEVVTREYIDPEQRTLDYVLVFIPNEQIYQYIHEHDSALIETAMTSKVVLCSPVTLFAILLVIRQAVDNFTLEQTSNRVIAQMGAFKSQWDNFMEQLVLVGRRLDSFHSSFNTLIERRRRALERPLNRIEAMRQERGLGLPTDFDDVDGEAELELSQPEFVESLDRES
ncbi:MAG: hypothetical protein BZY88_17250 [SAR202 cluster bacterium Io17-Chloro-G9]|nr:MAG: hypothetical protein BZY88_17250 [SAR202 cluster bacterium Io17-Chloro-G9]